ncbi:MAG TPA: ABC transporter ATP-binding protein [Acidobacteriota bacterium]|nr:ABC transporter ATP-binding protein [Acidobacteriota bacterium]
MSRPQDSEHGGHLRLRGVAKQYGDFTAVRDVDLDVTAGEFFSLLGPSGCGKTTMLRMVAGFERPSRGKIFLDGEDLSETPPHKRNVNTVFQSYALFPHLTVGDNVAFGLRFRKGSRSEIHDKVRATLELVHMESMADRKPARLSGGQQQRVALARALVLDPAVLLLDEPLGALDAQLKKTLQIELKRIQERVGITFVYVTHDQEEAMALSDRMCVMHEGTMRQIGRPRQVYEEPASAFVADFLGISNVIAATALGRDGTAGCRVAIGDHELIAEAGDVDAAGKIRVMLRPERLRVGAPEQSGPNRLHGVIERLVYLGPTTQVFVQLDGGPTVQALISNRDDAIEHSRGSRVSVGLPSSSLRVLTDG